MDFGTLTLYRRGEPAQPFRLRLGSMTIGSDPAADIAVEDPSLGRFHARIVCTPSGCQLTDLGATGGTFVNRARLAAHTPQLLGDGDRIQMGRIGLIYMAAQPANGAATDSNPQPTPTDAPAADPTPGPAEHAARAPVGVGVSEQREEPVDPALPATPLPVPAVAPPPIPTARPATLPAGATPTPADDWAELFQTPLAPTASKATRMLRGNRGRSALRANRDLPYAADDYLALLPPIYHGDAFLRRFLLIFKSILDPLDRQIGQLSHYFDPRLAPEQLLPWLAAWVDLTLDEKWPLERRRELVGAASTLYRWRGTRRGLSDYLRIYTGVTPQIVEPGQERREQGVAALPPHTFRVVLEVPDPEALDRALVERIIEVEKPAHTAYTLEIRRAR